MTMEPLVLASSSPRRRQLLEMLGIPLIVRPSHIPETRRPGEPPVEYSRRLAGEKAASVTGGLVLGADTIVVLDGEILEKPDDAAHALDILRKLQSRTHQVVTSVALRSDGRTRTLTDITAVTFRPAADDVLRAYIATGEPMDKAGAYGIQGYGAALIERVEGDFFGVMGLPVRLVLDLLAEAGRPYGFGEEVRSEKGEGRREKGTG
ncbi:MAG: nucleoside triphosphate pyrophosphatase [Gemmatimonadales bacterium]